MPATFHPRQFLAETGPNGQSAATFYCVRLYGDLSPLHNRSRQVHSHGNNFKIGSQEASQASRTSEKEEDDVPIHRWWRRTSTSLCRLQRPEDTEESDRPRRPYSASPPDRHISSVSASGADCHPASPLHRPAAIRLRRLKPQQPEAISPVPIHTGLFHARSDHRYSAHAAILAPKPTACCRAACTSTFLRSDVSHTRQHLMQMNDDFPFACDSRRTACCKCSNHE